MHGGTSIKIKFMNDALAVTVDLICFVGHGIYQFENRYFRYEGEWRNGVKHGKLCL
jgi:hypothetical protein